MKWMSVLVVLKDSHEERGMVARVLEGVNRPGQLACAGGEAQ
jgi:hypothetical protein